MVYGYGRVGSLTGLYESCIFKSDDNGRQFHYLARIAGPDDVAQWVKKSGYHGPAEPGMVDLGGKELLCLMRLGAKGGASLPLLQARSKDGGATWEKDELLVDGVMPAIARLDNGVLAATLGRPGSVLMFSADKGRTWGKEITLVPPDIRTSGYVDMLEVSPNRLLVVYDTFDQPIERFWLWDPPIKRNIIWGVFVDVSKLF